VSLSIGPEMKFFRWILSHLTIIVLLSVIFYFFWNKDDFGADEANPIKTPRVESPIEQQRDTTDAAKITKSDNNQSLNKSSVVTKSLENQTASELNAESDFSRRMKAYKKTLSSEQLKIMDEAGKTFHQKSERAVKSVDSNKLVFIDKPGVAFKDDTSLEQDALKKIPQQHLGELQEPGYDTGDVIAKNPEVDEIINAGTVADKVISDEDKPQHVNALTKQEKMPGNKDKNLQQQIRDRQKQLQRQMVLLVPLDVKKKTDAKIKNTYTELIKPVVYTPEQKQLLGGARHAVDIHDFKTAEKNYLELIKRLPEFPDVVGELADVYKAQNKMQYYLLTNTQYVKKLVAYNRFAEAENVVIVTEKIDKQTANKQRRIINNKQNELH